MKHDLALVTNGDRAVGREATVKCTCGIVTVLAGKFELSGDVTETALEAIANHAALEENVTVVHSALDIRERWV